MNEHGVARLFDDLSKMKREWIPVEETLPVENEIVEVRFVPMDLYVKTLKGVNRGHEMLNEPSLELDPFNDPSTLMEGVNFVKNGKWKLDYQVVKFWRW